MKIYNFLFDPELNNLRLNMDAALVEPLNKDSAIKFLDRDLILNLGKPAETLLHTNLLNNNTSTDKKISPNCSRDKDNPRILHPKKSYSPKEVLKSHKLSKARFNENLKKVNFVRVITDDDETDKDEKTKLVNQKNLSKNQTIVEKIKNS